MSNLNKVFEGSFGFEIEANEIDAARTGGALIHSFYRHEDDEEKTHYAAMPRVVEAYHRSGGTWSYSS